MKLFSYKPSLVTSNSLIIAKLKLVNPFTTNQISIRRSRDQRPNLLPLQGLILSIHDFTPLRVFGGYLIRRRLSIGII